MEPAALESGGGRNRRTLMAAFPRPSAYLVALKRRAVASRQVDQHARANTLAGANPNGRPVQILAVRPGSAWKLSSQAKPASYLPRASRCHLRC